MIVPAVLPFVCIAATQVGSSTPNFDAMAGNPLAKQIPWDTNPAYLAAWKQGRTGVAVH
jgi:deoxyribodipyrimidine photolyase